ncbi:MAG TPA: nucleotide disphospho-sugar-binding domain-containing protein [Bryobacteraceae bacterium]|jgi:MGT family glycosyltransferase|nr:nucleotide disphospho-sugar-binding domain-containing protein [Bryobacteraceae bacterium]
MHFGIISPPVPGHIHPFGALGRELMARGHRVTLFHMPDVEERARHEGLGFVAIGSLDHPAGSLPDSFAKLTRLNGLAALRFTIEAIRKTTEMMCRDAPAALRYAGVGFLLADQTEPAGRTIAEHLCLPFVTICNALALNREPSVPPPFTAWAYRDSWPARMRNQIGYAMSDRIMRSIAQVISKYRVRWKLPAHRHAEQSFSRLAQISQQPPAFDYPRRRLPRSFHYVGPLRRPSAQAVPFPWDELDGRPLVYASLGTLQNGREATFRCFAEACAGIDVQLVLTHGGGLDARAVSDLPGKPVVVSYAPQLELLSRASLTLTHAGLNTVLDSLSCGVPLVATPITYEQPAIAQRVEWCGAGRTVPFAKLQVDRVRAAVREVLADTGYRANAERVRDSIRQAGGVTRAADLIESFLG